jgi:hypothetical protein
VNVVDISKLNRVDSSTFLVLKKDRSITPLRFGPLGTYIRSFLSTCDFASLSFYYSFQENVFQPIPWGTVNTARYTLAQKYALAHGSPWRVTPDVPM